MSRKDFQIEMINSAAELKPWRQKWLDLLAQQAWPTVFHHPDWLDACFAVKSNQLKICLITYQAELAAAFVLSVIKTEGGAFLYPVNSFSLEPQISTVRPPCLIGIVDDKYKNLPMQAAWELAISKIKWQVGFFQYINQREDWLILPLKKYLAQQNYQLSSGKSAPEAYINLQLPAEEIIDSRPSKLKRTLNNAQNRLEKERSHKYLELSEAGFAWPQAQQTMLEIFGKSWQSSSPISPLHHQNIDYLLPVLKKFYLRDQFRILVLYINGQPAAYEAYFLYANTLFPVSRCFADAYKRFSPGNLLIKKSIWFFSEKNIKGIYYGPFRRVDKTGYKQRWATEIWETPNLLCLKPFSSYGVLHNIYQSSSLFRKIWWKLKKSK
jgi:hypothetical protein